MANRRKGERNEVWVDLARNRGMSYAEIGRMFNESRQLVWAVVQRELARERAARWPGEGGR